MIRNKRLKILALATCMAALASCAGGGRQDDNQNVAMEGLSSRLGKNYGYQVDEKGNWVPRNDKRSQYEGQGESAYFNGDYQKKSFQTEKLQKGSWMGNKEVSRPQHRLSGSQSSMGSASRLSNQQASLDRRLQTPARIEGNHLPGRRATESGANPIANTPDAETDVRRRVFAQPDIIDYRQQRELSIQESKQLLGRE